METNITRFPARDAPPDDAVDDGAFSLDQVETLGHALARLKDELRDTIGDRVAAAASIAKIELEARLAGAPDVAKTDLHSAFDAGFARVRDAL